MTKYNRKQLVGLDYVSLLPKTLKGFHQEPGLLWRFFTNPKAVTRVFNHSSNIYIVNGLGYLQPVNQKLRPVISKAGELQLVSLWTLPPTEQEVATRPFAYYDGPRLKEMTQDFGIFINYILDCEPDDIQLVTEDFDGFESANGRLTLASGHGWEIRKKQLTSAVFANKLYGAELIIHDQEILEKLNQVNFGHSRYDSRFENKALAQTGVANRTASQLFNLPRFSIDIRPGNT